MKTLIWLGSFLIASMTCFLSCEKENDNISGGNNSTSYVCINGDCQVDTSGANTYSSLSDCQSGCGGSITYECINGNCDTSSNGTYSSLSKCRSACGNSISCPSSFTDPRDGQTYAIVQIGNQCWFAENLNYATDKSWCYENNTDNCNTYGRLYFWQSALTACPSGWHLPSDAEWTTLIDHLGGRTVAGGKMKTTSGWNAPNTDATNTSGFSGYPGGWRTYDGSFFTMGDYGYWWSSTGDGAASAWGRRLPWNFGLVYRTTQDKESGYSCRCLKD